MKFSQSLIIRGALSAALLLATGGVALAAQTSKQPSSNTTSTSATTTHEEIGTITSMTNSDLVLSHTYKGKEESTTFKMDSNTKKEGTIDKGARVAVYFTDQNHERIATKVKAEPKKS
jgi:hypothetical protein